jgi:hypothetical protein
MGSSEPMIPIDEKIERRWTEMKVYFPLAKAKKLIPADTFFTPRAAIGYADLSAVLHHCRGYGLKMPLLSTLFPFASGLGVIGRGDTVSGTLPFP